MKVITEVRLRELIRGLNIDHEHKEIAADLIDSLEEIDTLIVSKLRPMCDAPKDGNAILCVFNGSENFQEMYFTDGLWWLSGVETYFNEDHITGWIEKPIYKTELAGDGE